MTRRPLVLALVAAPAVAVVARLLLTPWVQDNNQTDWPRILGTIAENQSAHEIGALLTYLSGMLYAVAAVTVGQVTRERSRRLATTGAALAVVGGFGLVDFAEVTLLASAAARVDDREAMATFFDTASTAPLGFVGYLLLIIGAVGWLLLGAALFRTRTGPRIAAVLVGIGGAGVMLTAPGPLISFIAGSAVISLVGLAWLAASRPVEGPREVVSPAGTQDSA
ncbi:MAG: DUF4386 family protein [Aeromicrobium sp.]